MASEDLELVRRAYEDFKRDGIEALTRYADPDLEFHEDPRFPEAGVYRGLDAFRAYTDRFQEAFAEFDFEAEELIDAGGGRVVALTVTGGVGKDSGAEVMARSAWIFTVRGGKIARMDAFLDRDEALKAAGVG